MSSFLSGGAQSAPLYESSSSFLLAIKNGAEIHHAAEDGVVRRFVSYTIENVTS